jgi:hypothetical protein
VGKPEERRQLGRPRRRWDDNIKMEAQKVRENMDSIDLIRHSDRWPTVVNEVMKCYLVICTVETVKANFGYNLVLGRNENISDKSQSVNHLVHAIVFIHVFN